MSQPPPPFGEPTFPPPGWTGPPALDLNAMPHFLDGGNWVSFDRMHWWNGSAWVPGPPPMVSQPPAGLVRPSTPGAVGPFAVVVALIGLVLFGIFAMSMCQSAPQPLLR